uniref:Ankyrin repeat and SOCS box protein 11 n=1 Tax=Astyanax mexicanus TaxID=7994 RepID=A0A3B1J8H7_ASTMX
MCCSWPQFVIKCVCVCVCVSGLWADRTPLHDAALQGRLLPLRRLLSQGLHADMVTLNGVTPLHEACLGGHLACAKLLLDHGANASAVSADGATPLLYACYSGNPALLRVLLKHSSAHHPAHLLNSPIHAAAKRNHTECVELLLSHGVNANMVVAGEGTPLYCACEARSTESVQRLLLLGADVHCGRGCDTPLHAAVRVGGAKEVELLLEHGADRKCRNSEGRTPLDLTTDNHIKHLLQTAGTRSLSQLSRLCIRQTLGQKRLNKAKVLHLPHILHSYLLYQ